MAAAEEKGAGRRKTGREWKRTKKRKGRSTTCMPLHEGSAELRDRAWFDTASSEDQPRMK